jgi:probable ATP-dependent RNA helicase DDX4
MPTIEKLMNHETMSERNTRQTLMFSATFPDEIQSAASQFLNNYVFLSVGIVGGASTDVEQQFFEVTKFKKREKLNVSSFSLDFFTKSFCFKKFL